MDVLVLGGGASGMMAALAASESGGHHITLLERQGRVGKKLSATGNGRCNLTNRNASAAHYHGDAAFAQQVLNAFPVQDTLRWFEQLGLLTVTEEDGRVYPFSDQAGSVVDVLRLAVEAAGVELVSGCEVTRLKKNGGRFTVVCDNGTYSADAVIVACGGPAGEKLGGTDTGSRLLRSMGHTCTELRPALVQLCTDPTWVRSLKGIRSICKVRLLSGEKELAASEGEVQFTEYGLSGPAIFEISRAASVASAPCTVELDLLPTMTGFTLKRFLSDHVSRYPERPLEDLLTGLLQNRLGRTVLRACGFSFERRADTLTERDLRKLAEKLRRFSFPVEKTMGMDHAQVTAGGIDPAEFDPRTMESRLVKGLYACGEVLNVDGDCGGYNLQWAWSSGRIAGLHSVMGECYDQNP